MNKNHWKELFEATGMLAIIASLIFVGLQVQQDRHLTRAELAAQSFDNLAMLRLTMSSPEFANAFAKALERPEDLTVGEKLQINSYLHAFTILVMRECNLVTKDIFAECKNIVEGIGPSLFSNKYAQSWWRTNWALTAAFLPSWVDSTITSFDVDSNLGELDNIGADQ